MERSQDGAKLSTWPEFQQQNLPAPEGLGEAGSLKMGRESFREVSKLCSWGGSPSPWLFLGIGEGFDDLCDEALLNFCGFRGTDGENASGLAGPFKVGLDADKRSL